MSKTCQSLSSKIDYRIFGRVEEVLKLDINNHAKTNLICDVIKEEVECLAQEMYEEGYYDGQDDENYQCPYCDELEDECEDLRDRLSRIEDIVNGW